MKSDLDTIFEELHRKLVLYKMKHNVSTDEVLKRLPYRIKTKDLFNFETLPLDYNKIDMEFKLSAGLIDASKITVSNEISEEAIEKMSKNLYMLKFKEEGD